ncbi:MAG: hypothetical protein LBD17_04580 [Endomicrobium sp.]|jgi:mRNA-degrading endonuclease RelE of RelBE toxin-antitoxin system|nr:hypothetical protein [Endomicrobium sp.]
MAKILRFSIRFAKNYKKLPKHIQELVERKLEFLKNNPRHQSLNVHRFVISGNTNIYEAYITKNYRFTFEIHKDKIILKNVGTHEIIDKGLVN